MAASILIVFDIGSSSVRAAAFTIPGDSRTPTVIKETLQQRHCSFNEYGEGDPHIILLHVDTCLDAILTILDSISVSTDTQFTVNKIGFTSFAMSWLGVDELGTPVTPIYTYARRNDNSESAVNELR